MPNLHIYMLAGTPDATRRAILRRATETVSRSLSAPRQSVRIFLFELAARDIAVGGEALDTLGPEARDFAGPTVHVFLIAGRSDAQKAQLIEQLSHDLAEELGIDCEPIRIMIIDIPNTDFGLCAMTAAAAGR